MNALSPSFPHVPSAPTALAFLKRRLMEVIGTALLFLTLLLALALLSHNAGDPSFSRAVDQAPHNILGRFGADLSDALIQAVGQASLLLPLLSGVWGLRLILNLSLRRPLLRLLAIVPALLASAVALQILPDAGGFGPPTGSGGVFGWAVLHEAASLGCPPIAVSLVAAALLAPLAMLLLGMPTFTRAGVRQALSYRPPVDVLEIGRAAGSMGAASGRVGGRGMLGAFRAVGRGTGWLAGTLGRQALSRFTRGDRPEKAPVPATAARDRYEPQFGEAAARRPAAQQGSREPSPDPDDDDDREEQAAPVKPLPARDERDGALRGQPMALRPDLVSPGKRRLPPGKRAEDSRQATLDLEPGNLTLPPLDLLQPPPRNRPAAVDQDALEQNARLLVGVLDDFGVRGEIVKIRPGPVVTLYELEPAPGTKSSRVIGLADDLARSMSAISVRVAVIPGRNVIGIELPNAKAETVVLRELVESGAYEKAQARLTLVLGKDIGGEPVIADLAKMPHLLIAGTTGSGKSVGINTMILSILYRMPPSLCKFIMIDPKMLELSIYDGIPHLLSPVVTDPRKAVVALKWTVREMEDRYRAMSKLGVRNIEGYNAKLAEANARGETLVRKVQTGFDPETGEPIVEDQLLDLSPLPFIIVVVDEMADLMLVAGKDIEAAIQRLAQMARAAGIHIIMATQRPSVDVITGTIKANFPTRISFQVTSKIDSRTILGESGAEQLLGRGDMLYMAGGGRITRVHGPFVSDGEVEEVVNFLKSQGQPNYIDSITEGDEDELPAIEPVGGGDGSDQLYDQAIALVARERKASTSFVQRHLQIGYNRAARIIERMEMEGVVSAPNHVGKREVLAPKREY